MIQPAAFYALAVLIVVCALLVVSVRNIFHAGLYLIGSFLAVAGLYIGLQNFFLAAMQLLIYSGAVAVLILFGVMMTHRYWSAESGAHHASRLLTAPLALALFCALAAADASIPAAPVHPQGAGLLRAVGVDLMQAHMLPFEIISLVLLAALIGAIAVAKEEE